MKGKNYLNPVFIILAVSTAYFFVARVSLSFLVQPEGIAAIWPPEGIFLSSLLLIRKKLKPYLAVSLFIADFVSEILAGIPSNVSFFYSLALTLDALFDSFLLNRFLNEEISFEKVKHIAAFLFLSVFLSNSINSIIAAGAASYFLNSPFGYSYMWWVSSNGIGNIIMTPFIISVAMLIKHKEAEIKKSQLLEYLVLIIVLLAFNVYTFHSFSESELFSLFLNYLTLPFLIYSVMRFGVKGVSGAIVIISVISLSFVLSGKVMLSASGSILDSAMNLQLYIAIMSISFLFFAAVVAERENAQKNLSASEERLRTTLYSIGDGVIATDENGFVKQINPIAENLTGWSEEKAKGRKLEEIFRIINEESRLIVENPVQRILRDGKIIGLANHTLLISRDGHEIPIADSGAPIRELNGEMKGVVLVFRDQTYERNAQTKIINSLKEKEILLKEIHHRVKNNFQRIISLIMLQSEFIEDKNAKNILEELQSRLRSMAMIHELMYGSGNFVDVNVKDYISKLSNSLIDSNNYSKNINLELEIENHSLNLDSIIPCGLIINEFITNSLKYAFPENCPGTIRISYKFAENEYCLKLSDDGIGFKKRIDFENIHTLGLRLIELFVKQLRGSLLVEYPEKGTMFVIRFKE